MEVILECRFISPSFIYSSECMAMYIIVRVIMALIMIKTMQNGDICIENS
jgi:hypothetical protein